MKGALRMSWSMPSLGVLVLAVKILDRYSPKPEPPTDPILLGAYCVLALVIAAVLARDVWNLKVRHFPLWFDALGYILCLGGLAVFIYLKETSKPWLSMGYLDLPIILFMFTIAAAAIATEKRKKVRVYFGARTLMFKHDEAAL
jgi:hypothetical protein